MILQVCCEIVLFYDQFGKQILPYYLVNQVKKLTLIGRFDMYQSSHVFFSYSVFYAYIFKKGLFICYVYIMVVIEMIF